MFEIGDKVMCKNNKYIKGEIIDIVDNKYVLSIGGIIPFEDQKHFEKLDENGYSLEEEF